MDSRYHNQQFSSELLLTASALREVGFDHEADLFRDALFDRRHTEQALHCLRMRVQHAASDDGQLANETAARLLDRLQRQLS